MTSVGLRSTGFRVVEAADGEEGWERFRRDRPEVVVLDLMLPRLDGMSLCRRIRSESSVPVVMLTARSDPLDIVVGLEAGADDYITKPFDLPVLAARLRAVLRRVAGGEPPELLRLGPLVIDLPAYTVTSDGREIPLTPTEFRLLCELARRPGQVFTREMLLERVWGYDYLGDSRLVDVTVQRLRAKVEPDPQHPRLVETVRGVGYKAGR